METLDFKELWKIIPPEEKVAMMSKAHARGIFGAAIFIIAFATAAVALKIVALMWFGIIFSPIVFQFIAGKAFKDLRPRLMLEYLAARSAARRFAFTTGARDLSLALMFRGRLEEVHSRSDLQEALAAIVDNNKASEVWIALFRDAVIAMSERQGGAMMNIGSIVNDKISIKSSDNGDYAEQKEITLAMKDRLDQQKVYKITSDFPGALVVFEKLFLRFQEESRKALDSAVMIPAADKGYVTFND